MVNKKLKENKEEGIVITSYYFQPENTPRAFRTFELAKYFSSQGKMVYVVIPDYNYDYSQIENNYNMKIIQTKARFGRKKINSEKKSGAGDNSILKIPIIKNFLRYFIGTKDFLFCIPLFKFLKELHIQKNISKYSFIAIALPFSVTLGTAFLLRKLRINKSNAIAEYGDPYYFNPAIKRLFIHKYIEKYALNYFNFITVPTPNIRNCYTYYKKESRIITIPQGFELENIELSNFVSNNPVTFGYTGSFYENQRISIIDFMEFLVTLDMNFKFIVFTDLKMKIGDGVKLILPYQSKLGSKLEINDLIPRKDCIKEISKMNFLIYINSDSGDFIPSKLIDYKISKRPVLLVDKTKGYREVFQEFIAEDYTKDHMNNIDLNYYDIKNVGKKFESLLATGDY